MTEIQIDDGGRPNPAARDAMLVSCIRCGALHPPTHPLDFHPLCIGCSLDCLPR